MPHMLLFCIAKKAKPLVPKILDVRSDGGPQLKPRVFFLVESHTCPNDQDGFKIELKDDETFETDFIGASVHDCQKWALEKQFQVNFIEQNLIGIADARTAKDGTISMQYYAQALPPPASEFEREHEDFEFEGFGVLPPKRDIWYEFRIDYKDAAKVVSHLGYGPIDFVFPTYFGRKAELTDESGVFDMVKATRYVHGLHGRDPNTGEFPNSGSVSA